MSSKPAWFSDDDLAARASAAIDEMTLPALGEFPASMFGPPSEPGPPYTHVITGPKAAYSRSGKLLYWEPSPPYTLTTEPVTITADFCQCTGCRAERCEP